MNKLDKEIYGHEDVLKIPSETLSLILNISPDAIALTRVSDGKFIDCNKKYLDQIGYSKEEVIGKTTEELNLYVDDNRMEYVDANLKNNNVNDFELNVRRKNGEIIDVLYSCKLINRDGEKILLNMGKDITENKITEFNLKESERIYKNIIDNLQDGFFRLDNEGVIRMASPSLAKIYGFNSAEDIIGSTAIPLYKNIDDRTKLMGRLKKQGQITDYEVKSLRTDGRSIWCSVNAQYIYDEKNEIEGIDGFVRDITKRKNTELHLQKMLKEKQELTSELQITNKNLETTTMELQEVNDKLKHQQTHLVDLNKALKKNEAKIKSTLDEKEILIKEIHHRVKNNMQIISSLLNLQTKYVNDLEALDVLLESQNRVKSMAMIHEKLYLSEDLTHINLVGYIQNLVSNLFYSYNIEKSRINLVFDLEDVNLNMETAIPCGLIISELVSNSLKYAFPNGKKGELFISLRSSGEKYELIIRDNGIGFSEDFEFNEIDSLGLLLVNNLVDQINGNISIDSADGAGFNIEFSELKYKNRFDG